MAGILHIVSTPIGNLGDITYRAVDVLKSVDLIACEDTRHSKILLDHYEIRKPLLSYFDHSETKRTPQIIERLKEGQSVALISDSGTPGLADPGFRVIREAIRQGITVQALPGPSAILPALILSGLPVDRFVFEGFLPVKDGQRRRYLESLKNETRTIIFYESPHRLLKTLAAMKDVYGDIEIALVRELTKKFEEVIRKPLSEILASYSEKKVLGEFVILFHLTDQVR